MTRVIVVDASILARALGDDNADGIRARARLVGELPVAPELIDLEILAAWRRQTRRGSSHSPGQSDLADAPLRRHPHRPLLARCWELRDTATPYDAVYVALGEALGVPMLTADARLARATGPHCAFEVLE